MKNVQYRQRINFTQDFLDTFEVFMEMIKHDKEIEKTLKIGNTEKGRFSAAVRFLISKYVKENAQDFKAFKKIKEIKEDD